MSTNAKDFYFYSLTDRRTVLQEQPKGELAYKLIEVPDGTDLREEPHRGSRWFMVTTVFGKHQDKYKLESRIMRGFDAMNWASWVQSQNPGKKIKLWKIHVDNTMTLAQIPEE